MYYGDTEFRLMQALFVLAFFVVPAVIAIIVLKWAIGRGKRAIDAKVAILERQAKGQDR